MDAKYAGKSVVLPKEYECKNCDTLIYEGDSMDSRWRHRDGGSIWCHPYNGDSNDPKSYMKAEPRETTSCSTK